MLGTCPPKHCIYPNARHGYYSNLPLKNMGSLLICLKDNEVFHVTPKQHVSWNSHKCSLQKEENIL